MPATNTIGAAHSIKERLRIGSEVKRRLDALIPERDRLTDTQLAKALGVSQQAASREVSLICYKMHMRLKELVKAELEARNR